MKLAEKLKSNSSRWMKTKADFLKDFEWQLGYAVYSIGESEIPRLKKYIQNQKSTIPILSFQEETEISLKRTSTNPSGRHE